MEENRVQKLVDTRQRIISFIKIRGPVLPVHAAKEAGISMLFASAFLSELVSDRTLKISNLKVGGSPLYFLPGQEPMLDNFFRYLPGKEREAYLLLKESKVLQDDRQEPAIRVAIRQLKDFAFPFRLGTSEIIFWRYFTVAEEEARNIAESFAPKIQVPVRIEPPVEIILQRPEPIIEAPKPFLPEKQIVIKQEQKPEQISIPIQEKQEIRVEKPLVKIKVAKKDKPKPQEFLNEIKEFLVGKDIEFLHEIFFDKKEVIGKIRINSDLGKITLLLVAKDKKRIVESDLISAYQKAINEKMPCYFLARGDLSDNTKESLEGYKNLIKFDKISKR